ncbi:MAG: hypothetical protein E7551_04790 [Ruminococcaceae bacterium]|nr:hypothetical protein [Oscillospiraceae bacterium]
MGYLLLTAALFAGLFKGYIGKQTSFSVKSFNDGIFVNMLRCLFCSVLGFMVVIIEKGFQGFEMSLTELGVCFMSAIFSAVFCVAWLYAYKSEAYMFLSIFTMLGAIVTGVLGLLIYDEVISIYKIIGMILLIVAVYIMSFYNNDLKGKLSASALVLLIVGALGSALADFSQKIYRNSGTENSSAFTFYTYFIAFVLQLIIWVAIRTKSSATAKDLYSKKYLIFYILYSVFLYINLLSKTLAAGLLPASFMYPTLQGANLIFSAVMASVLMKEKPNKKSILSIVVALIAILLMNK